MSPGAGVGGCVRAQEGGERVVAQAAISAREIISPGMRTLATPSPIPLKALRQRC